MNLKKKSIFIVTVLFVFVLYVNVFSNSAKNDKSLNVVFEINKNIMYVGDEWKILDVPPMIINGRTLVPLRALIESFGGKTEWDNYQKRIDIELNGNKLILWIGNENSYVNNVMKVMDVPAQIINDRTMIPIRFVSENLGFKVDWDSVKNQILINGNQDYPNNPINTFTPNSEDIPIPTPSPMPLQLNIPKYSDDELSKIEMLENQQVIEISSIDEYKKILKLALENFISSIKIKAYNFDKDLYDNDYVNEIIENDPLVNFGYNGGSYNYRWYEGGSVGELNVYLNYKLTKEQMKNMKKMVEEKSKEIVLKIINNNMTDEQKVKTIHDYIVNNSKYDYENFKNNTISPESYSDYGILINGIGVCEGYAKAFLRMCKLLDIKCIMITGDVANGPHAWNLVQLNGVYWHVDVTYDDPVVSDGSDILQYEYYLKTDNQMSKDHNWDKSKYPTTLN